MPKKNTGRKVPMNKIQRNKMKKDANRVTGYEGMGSEGLFRLIFGPKKRK